MTTDEEEGKRQIAAMQPAPFKVGDKVRLSAGSQTMTVVALEDYGNMAVCEWEPEPVPPDHAAQYRDTFSARSLVRVEG